MASKSQTEQKMKKSPLAIASFVIGIVSAAGFFFAPFAQIAGVIAIGLGIGALLMINASKELHGRIFAWIGIVLGIVSMYVIGIIILFFTYLMSSGAGL